MLPLPPERDCEDEPPVEFECELRALRTDGSFEDSMSRNECCGSVLGSLPVLERIDLSLGDAAGDPPVPVGGTCPVSAVIRECGNDIPPALVYRDSRRCLDLSLGSSSKLTRKAPGSVGGINAVSTSASGERSSGNNIPRFIAMGGNDVCISLGPLGRTMGDDSGGLDARRALDDFDDPELPFPPVGT